MSPGAGLGTGPVTQLTALDTQDEEDDGLDVIDRALDELNAALSTDPENKNLSKLVLMVHQKRGNLLRRTTGNPGLE